MIETITAVNHAVNQFIWGVPAMVCIIGVGLLLSVRTGFLQIRKFPYAIKTTIGRMFRKKDASDGAMTPFQAVCTALAGTVGTGNIAGVAGAIAIGGPGAVFPVPPAQKKIKAIRDRKKASNPRPHRLTKE